MVHFKRQKEYIKLYKYIHKFGVYEFCSLQASCFWMVCFQLCRNMAWNMHRTLDQPGNQQAQEMIESDLSCIRTGRPTSIGSLTTSRFGHMMWLMRWVPSSNLAWCAKKKSAIKMSVLRWLSGSSHCNRSLQESIDSHNLPPHQPAKAPLSWPAISKHHTKPTVTIQQRNQQGWEILWTMVPHPGPCQSDHPSVRLRCGAHSELRAASQILSH